MSLPFLENVMTVEAAHDVFEWLESRESGATKRSVWESSGLSSECPMEVEVLSKK